MAKNWRREKGNKASILRRAFRLCCNHVFRAARNARHIPLLLAFYAVVSAPRHGQESVCSLFRDLKTADGRQLILTGDLIISKGLTALGAADCDNQYRSRISGTSGPFQIWPTAVHLRPSSVVHQKQIQQLQKAAATADGLRRDGEPLSASATFAGRCGSHPPTTFRRN
jgi:hypothetical protein